MNISNANPSAFSPIKKKQLNIADTMALKGIALCLLLIHHLFWVQKGLYNDLIIGNHGIVNEIGKSSKLCVAIFVFLSGYGLTIQSEHKGGIGNLWMFYKHRLLKLMINYWIIWCIFVPIGVFFFDCSLDDAYQNHVLIKAIIDILGLAFAFGYYGYNATWWFMSCIIVLYVFFPFFYKLVKAHQMETLFSLIALSLLPIHFCQQEIVKYALPFVLGIIIAIHGVPSVCGGGKIALLALAFSILLMFAQRMIINRPIIIDSALCIALSAFWFRMPRKNILQSSLTYLGRHSMNIFLFHTFIYYHWFKYYIYAPRNPLLIFLLLLSVCL